MDVDLEGFHDPEEFQFDPDELAKMEHASKHLKELLVERHFMDVEKMWTHKELLPVAYEFFLKEQDSGIMVLQQKFTGNQDSVSDPEKGVLGSAYIIEHFLEKEFGGRGSVCGRDAIGMLSFARYEEYGDSHVEEMMGKLDEIFGKRPG